MRRQIGESYAPQEFWDASYAELAPKYDPAAILFRSTFDRFLQPGGTCFEIGCYPGNFLIYLAKTFGYRVHGIDQTPYVADRLPAHLAAHDVAIGNLHRGDFFAFEAPITYNVVCSFGFVEHFRETEDVLHRHMALVAPGGMLIVSCPNFRRVQYLLHRVLDTENLRRHVLPAMNLSRWRRCVEQGGFTVLHAGYEGTAGFWTESQSATDLQRAIALKVAQVAGGINKHVAWPNRWLSPHMVLVARRSS